MEAQKSPRGTQRGGKNPENAVGAPSDDNGEPSIRGYGVQNQRRRTQNASGHLDIAGTGGGASASGPGRGAQKRPWQMRKAIAGRDIAGGVLSIRRMEGREADTSGVACAVLKRPWWVREASAGLGISGSTVDRVDGGAGGGGASEPSVRGCRAQGRGCKQEGQGGRASKLEHKGTIPGLGCRETGLREAKIRLMQSGVARGKGKGRNGSGSKREGKQVKSAKNGTIDPEMLAVSASLYVRVPVAGRVKITSLTGSLLSGVSAQINVVVASGSATLTAVPNPSTGKHDLMINASAEVALIGKVTTGGPIKLLSLPENSWKKKKANTFYVYYCYDHIVRKITSSNVAAALPLFWRGIICKVLTTTSKARVQGEEECPTSVRRPAVIATRVESYDPAKLLRGRRGTIILVTVKRFPSSAKIIENLTATCRENLPRNPEGPKTDVTDFRGIFLPDLPPQLEFSKDERVCWKTREFGDPRIIEGPSVAIPEAQTLGKCPIIDAVAPRVRKKGREMGKVGGILEAIDERVKVAVCVKVERDDPEEVREKVYQLINLCADGGLQFYDQPGPGTVGGDKVRGGGVWEASEPKKPEIGQRSSRVTVLPTTAENVTKHMNYAKFGRIDSKSLSELTRMLSSDAMTRARESGNILEILLKFWSQSPQKPASRTRFGKFWPQKPEFRTRKWPILDLKNLKFWTTPWCSFPGPINTDSGVEVQKLWQIRQHVQQRRHRHFPTRERWRCSEEMSSEPSKR
ncbi:hypothetical protein C8F04DRAFT_1195303 [Mycena alexandri]|uniref:Uncharacterized protein n=1 Tax=Mycena alexandri TaxID=1745969 RepID=A0AAD6S631_9AGAR|nr:hypothetical protein C8F04DRAFT_1195303 [Mycena alexandri]